MTISPNPLTAPKSVTIASKFGHNLVYTCKICGNREAKSLTEEMYKRLIIPFYIIIISLVAPFTNKFETSS